MDIFESRQQRELQRLRQSQASSVVTIDPNLKGFTSRFDPDVSRASLLRAQRARVPSESELQKQVGVKTLKKLKKRKKKNLRGEFARNLREQRRFERGERRDKPDEEVKILPDPAVAAAAAAAPVAAPVAAPAADPNDALRLAIEGRRIAAQDAQQRRLVEAVMARDVAERGERLAAQDRQAQERAEIIGRGEAERQALLDRQAAIAREERQDAIAERGRIIGGAELERDVLRAERLAVGERAEAERVELRGAFRTILEGETAFARQERQDFLDQSEAERAVLRRESREERAGLLEDRRGSDQSQEAIRQRVEEQRAVERREAAQERDELLGRLVRFTDEERRERIQREEQQAAGQVSERERQRVEREQREDRQAAEQVAERERQQVEREQVAAAAAEEREGILRLTLDADRPAAQAQPEPQQPPVINIAQPAINIAQPAINIEQPAQQPGPSAAEIAAGVRGALQDFVVSPRGRSSPRRSRSQSQTPPPPEEQTLRQTPLSTGLEVPSSPRGQDEGPPSPRGLQRGFDALERELGGRSKDFVPNLDADSDADSDAESDLPTPTAQRELRRQQTASPLPPVEAGVVSEPAQVPTERIQELEGSGVVVDSSNLPQQNRDDLFQSGQFAGGIEAAAQNAIGFVGDQAGRAAGGIANLINPPAAVGEQTGGALTDAEGNPIFGLGQEIEEPAAPTIQPLASQEPVRRVDTSRSPRAAGGRGGGGRPDTRSKLQKDKDALKGAQSQERRLLTAQKASKIANVSGVRQGFAAKGELKQVQQKIKDLEGSIQREEIQQRNRESMGQGGGGGGRPQAPPARVAPSARRTNLQLHDELIPEIKASYTRGRPLGGARGSLPFQITNTSDGFFKGLEPGQTVTIDQVESDGRVGYYPRGKTAGKTGITRIGDKELRKHVESGKLKTDRTR